MQLRDKVLNVSRICGDNARLRTLGEIRLPTENTTEHLKTRTFAEVQEGTERLIYEKWNPYAMLFLKP